jgi:hypothetical protein
MTTYIEIYPIIALTNTTFEITNKSQILLNINKLKPKPTHIKTINKTIYTYNSINLEIVDGKRSYNVSTSKLIKLTPNIMVSEITCKDVNSLVFPIIDKYTDERDETITKYRYNDIYFDLVIEKNGNNIVTFLRVDNMAYVDKLTILFQ